MTQFSILSLLGSHFAASSVQPWRENSFSYLEAGILTISHCCNIIKFKSAYTVYLRKLWIGQFNLIPHYKQITVITLIF